ncbi:MAG TPA: VOC family protein [Woeseiaceae bacterium]|nr:VOC family protein [Woeseiaceae bacterium]
MKLGAFSVSLSVADIEKSKTFYEALGFSAIGGEADQGWLIMRNGSTTIGLFQGMFDRNMLTFNPGWDAQCATLDSYDDVRTIQRELLTRGIELADTVDEKTEGPGSITVVDPDGNPILIDQHV